MTRPSRVSCCHQGALAIVLGAAIPTAVAADFRKGPYLLFRDDPAAMVVLWQADGATTTSTIEWGSSPAYGHGPIAVTSHGDDQYEHTIEGLLPAARCYYRVTVDGAAREGSFLAAPAAETDRVVLYAYGDSRSFPHRQNKVLRRLLEDVAVAPDLRQALAIGTGDLIDVGSSESAWQEQHFNRAYPWLTAFQRQVPFMSARGNHESPGALLRKYYPYAYADPDAFYYAFDYGPVHVTAVDDQAGRDPGSPQYEWIEDQFSSSTTPYQVVAFHEPAWGAGGGHANNATNQMLTANLFEPLGVDLALTGHNHHYARNEKAGLPHITTGGGGAPLHDPDPGYPYFVTAAKLHHFSRMSLKDGTLHVTAIDIAGQVIDNFYVRRGTDSGAPGIDAVRATEDAVSVTIAFDECVTAGSGPGGAENPARYEIPGVSVTAAARGAAEDTIRLSVAPRMVQGEVYSVTTRDVDDCAAVPNRMPSPASHDFRFEEGPGVVIEQGDDWAFRRGQSDPGPDWASVEFDDASWERGPLGIGYGDADDATVLGEMQGSYTTVFVRRRFTVCNAPLVRRMTLAVDYDDGFAAFLNGVRVAGRNDVHFTGHNHGAVASASHEAGGWERIDLTSQTGRLRGGENLLAIVLLNVESASSDATLIPELELTGGYCADVAPPPESAPGTPEEGSLEFSARDTLTWPINPDASEGYRLYRGEASDLPALADGRLDSCLRLRTWHSDETAADGLEDDPSSVAGRLYWYLVTGVNALGEGPSGAGPDGARRLDSRGDCPQAAGEPVRRPYDRRSPGRRSPADEAPPDATASVSSGPGTPGRRPPPRPLLRRRDP